MRCQAGIWKKMGAGVKCRVHPNLGENVIRWPIRIRVNLCKKKMGTQHKFQAKGLNYLLKSILGILLQLCSQTLDLPAVAFCKWLNKFEFHFQVHMCGFVWKQLLKNNLKMLIVTWPDMEFNLTSKARTTFNLFTDPKNGLVLGWVHTMFY
jgi:hypothetical protein